MIRNYKKMFEAEFSLDIDDEFEEEIIPHYNVIELGGYEWTKVGKIDGYDLYLCNDTVTDMKFSNKNNDWNESDIRNWLNTSFYNKLSNFEKDNIIKHPNTRDNIFLLSIDEAKKVDQNIRKLDHWWWLRSPGGDYYWAAFVLHGGGIDDIGDSVRNTRIGVRPALLLK